MESARPAPTLDSELAAVYTAAATDEDVGHRLCLLLALRAWRLISIAYGDNAPLDKTHPFGDSHLHDAMRRFQEASIAESTTLFVNAVSGLRNVCADVTKILGRHGGELPINALADGTALKEGCAGRFGETWHHVAVQIAFNLLAIVDAAIPRGKVLATDKMWRASSNTIVPIAEMLAELPEQVRPHFVVITSEMRAKVYDAIKRARLTVFNIEQLQARMNAECRRALSFEGLMKAKREGAAGPNAADNSKKSGPMLPDSPDVRDLCALLAKRHKTGKSLNKIAREFTHGNVPKANSLLRQARRFRHLWDSADK